MTAPPLPERLDRISPGRILVNALLNWLATLPATLGWTMLFFLPPAVVWSFLVAHLPPTGRVLWIAATVLVGAQAATAIAVAGLVAPRVIRRLASRRPRRARTWPLGPTLAGASATVGLLVTPGLLLVVPGLLLLARYLVAGPVAALEQPGARAALRGSRALATGHHGPLSLLLSLWLGGEALIFLVAWVLVVGPRIDPAAIETGTRLVAGLSIVLCSLLAHLAVAAHVELRLEERPLEEAVLRVFD